LPLTKLRPQPENVERAADESRINATLDPSSFDCYSTDNFGSAVTVDLVGKFDGSYRNSITGIGKQASGGATYQYKAKIDEFGETFTGRFGVQTGTFTGQASTVRYTNRQRVQ